MTKLALLNDKLKSFRARHDIKESFSLSIFRFCHTFLVSFLKAQFFVFFLLHKKIFLFSSPCVCGSRTSIALFSLHGTEDDVQLKSWKAPKIFPFSRSSSLLFFSLALLSDVHRVACFARVCVCMPRIHEWKRRYDICGSNSQPVACNISLWIYSIARYSLESSCGVRCFQHSVVFVIRWNVLRELFSHRNGMRLEAGWNFFCFHLNVLL